MTLRAKYELHLKQLEGRLVAMCDTVERAIEDTMRALVAADRELAETVAGNDPVIDDMERTIEQECLKILLMEHPVAGDFKEVSAILKMITDLERIADQSEDICQIILSMENGYTLNLRQIPLMGEIAESMVKDSVLAYVRRDESLAREVEERDNKVDRLFDEVKRSLVDFIKSDVENADEAILFMMIAKYLERIADHATNICEWTEYLVSGKRV